MRHGRSKANEAGIILSDPLSGRKEKWGLSETGKQQIRDQISSYKPPFSLQIISSDFSRAYETALLTAELLNLPAPLTDIRLRERFFGELEQQSDSLYPKVWAEDQKDETHQCFSVESAWSVQQRTSSLVKELEEKYTQRNFLLVSHGDALQILLTWFKGIKASRHRSLPHLNTAEIRQAN